MTSNLAAITGIDTKTAANRLHSIGSRVTGSRIAGSRSAGHLSRYWIWLVLAALVVNLTSSPAAAQQETSDDPVELRFKDYEAKIQALLKTRLPEEKAFVSAVMTLVRAGEIPEKMVETSFKWVQNKHPDTNYPFVYFERVLRLQGEKADIKIPPFDYDVYRDKLGRRSSNRNS